MITLINIKAKDNISKLVLHNKQFQYKFVVIVITVVK